MQINVRYASAAIALFAILASLTKNKLDNQIVAVLQEVVNALNSTTV